jgi:hypothetical protein
MRISLFLLICGLLGGLFLWVTLSGASLFLCSLLYALFWVLTIGFCDTSILFFLGAREIRSSDKPLFFEAAAQGAYKLSVSMPKLYFYNGSLERAFVLQNGSRITLVLSKDLIDDYQPMELAAICFELLLQVKKGLAGKRTKVMYLVGLKSWMAHSVVNMVTTLLPFRDIKVACDFCLNYFLHPWLEFIFSLTMGTGYFKKVAALISEYPREHELLNRVGLKLRRPAEIYSMPTRKMAQISSATRSRHYQNILALEFLPHEWDFIFMQEGIERAD